MPSLVETSIKDGKDGFDPTTVDETAISNIMTDGSGGDLSPSDRDKLIKARMAEADMRIRRKIEEKRSERKKKHADESIKTPEGLSSHNPLSSATRGDLTSSDSSDSIARVQSTSPVHPQRSEMNEMPSLCSSEEGSSSSRSSEGMLGAGLPIRPRKASPERTPQEIERRGEVDGLELSPTSQQSKDEYLPLSPDKYCSDPTSTKLSSLAAMLREESERLLKKHTGGQNTRSDDDRNNLSPFAAKNIFNGSPSRIIQKNDTMSSTSSSSGWPSNSEQSSPALEEVEEEDNTVSLEDSPLPTFPWLDKSGGKGTWIDSTPSSEELLRAIDEAERKWTYHGISTAPKNGANETSKKEQNLDNKSNASSFPSSKPKQGGEITHDDISSCVPALGGSTTVGTGTIGTGTNLVGLDLITIGTDGQTVAQDSVVGKCIQFDDGTETKFARGAAQCAVAQAVAEFEDVILEEDEEMEEGENDLALSTSDGTKRKEDESEMPSLDDETPQDVVGLHTKCFHDKDCDIEAGSKPEEVEEERSIATFMSSLREGSVRTGQLLSNLLGISSGESVQESSIKDAADEFGSYVSSELGNKGVKSSDGGRAVSPDVKEDDEHTPDDEPARNAISSACRKKNAVYIAAGLALTAVVGIGMWLIFAGPGESDVTSTKESAEPQEGTAPPTTLEAVANQDFSQSPTFAPTASPERAGTWLRSSRILEIVSNVSGEDAGDPKTAQGKALTWMLDEDERELPTDDELVVQRYVLVALHYALKMDQSEASRAASNPKGTFLDATRSECEWTGVTCSTGTDMVTGLDLPKAGLSGELLPELTELRGLTRLNLRSNSIGGHLPGSLGNLIQLSHLDVSMNRINGTLPSSIQHLRHLTHLDLRNNLLESTIPEGVHKLKKLVRLSLDGNALNGSLPDMAGMESLEVLKLEGNKLSGTIPTTLATLTQLTVLKLFGNKLSGPIPGEIGDLENLKDLHLYRNHLTGAIPPALGNLHRLEFLSLFENKLTGNIPEDMGRLTLLKSCSLDSNDLTGEVPEEVCKLRERGKLSFLSADCGGDAPEVECACCTECY